MSDSQPRERRNRNGHSMGRRAGSPGRRCRGCRRPIFASCCSSGAKDRLRSEDGRILPGRNLRANSARSRRGISARGMGECGRVLAPYGPRCCTTRRARLGARARTRPKRWGPSDRINVENSQSRSFSPMGIRRRGIGPYPIVRLSTRLTGPSTVNCGE